MGMTIDELITFCEEEEQNHRVKAKRADDASGYTRSKDKNIRTAVAIREEVYGDFYKQIADTMRKYQKIQEIINNAKDSDGVVKYNWLYEQIKEVIEDG
jgi:hypothetical protein